VEVILDLETAITLAQLQGRMALAQELQASLSAFKAKLEKSATPANQPLR
jgi:hypothetical protein